MSYATELRERQFRFMRNLANLIHYILDSGYGVSGGELWRSEETQSAHFKAGRSKTMDSLHLKRLAIDLNVFDDGYLLFSDHTRIEKDTEIMKAFGEQWKAYDSGNGWGGEFPSFFDPGHFEMRDK